MGKYHQVAVIFDLKRNSGKRATITKAENKSLNKWLSNQRQEYKKLERGVQASMTSKRIDLLEYIGMNLKKPKTSSPIAPKAAGVNETSTGVEFPTAGDGDDDGMVDVGSAKGNGETKKKGGSKLPDDEADGKSLTSTKRAPDVQPTSTCASVEKSDVDSPARPATTEAPPPATTGGSNEAAAAPVQTTVDTPAGSNSEADANASDDDDDDDGVLPDFEPMTEVVDGRYHFTHNVRLTCHPERNTFGIRLQSPGGDFRANSIGCLVQAVLPSCTAPDGAVQAGDRILSVNGTATRVEWSYHQIVTFIRETNPEVLVLSLRRELPEAEVAATATTAKAAPKTKARTRATEGTGGTDAKDPGQSSAKGNNESKKKGASKLPDEKKWVEWEAQKNTQIGADARPFVRVGFQEIGAESSEHKGILFLTKNMFLPETEILSHAQAVERKLTIRCAGRRGGISEAQAQNGVPPRHSQGRNRRRIGQS